MRRPDLRIRVQLTVSVCLFTLICLVSLAVSIYVLSRETILDLQVGNLDLNCRMIREECMQEVENEYETLYRLTASAPVRALYSSTANSASEAQSVSLLHDSFGSNRVLQLVLYYANGTIMQTINTSNLTLTFPDLFFPIETALQLDANATRSRNSTHFNSTVESILTYQGILVGPKQTNQTIGGTTYMLSLTLPVAASTGYLDPATASTVADVDGFATFVFTALRLQTILSAVSITSSENLVGSTALCTANARLTHFTQLIPFDDRTVIDYYNTSGYASEWSAYKEHSLLAFSGDFAIPPEMAAVIAQDELPPAGVDKGPEKSTISIAQFTIMNSTYYVVVLQSHHGVYEMPHTLRNNIVISSCAIAAAMVVFTFLFVSFGARQILRLKMAATYERPAHKWWWIMPVPWWLAPHASRPQSSKRDSSGSEEYAVPETVPLRRHVRDELDDITAKFNLMSSELEKQYTKLEKRVERRKAEIDRARESADLANAAKSHFLARVTHELRTPLNGIIGTATLCLDDDNIESVHTSLLTIFKCGELLLHLMTDLLSFSQNEVENVSLELRQFTIAEITSQLRAIFSEQCFSKKISLKVANSEALDPLLFQGDTNRILQVIFNLMSNGIKFTPPDGEVAFNATLGSRVASNVVDLVFTVTDNGPGIAPEMQDKVFEAFVQGDNISTQVKKAGVGLGLSICKQLAERMNGTIMLTSSLGSGCRFVFVVPLAFSSDLESSKESMEIQGSVVRSKRLGSDATARSPKSPKSQPTSPNKGSPSVSANTSERRVSISSILRLDQSPPRTDQNKDERHMFLSRTSRTLSTASLKAKEFTRRLTLDSAARQREKDAKRVRKRKPDEEGLLNASTDDLPVIVVPDSETSPSPPPLGSATVSPASALALPPFSYLQPSSQTSNAVDRQRSASEEIRRGLARPRSVDDVVNRPKPVRCATGPLSTLKSSTPPRRPSLPSVSSVSSPPSPKSPLSPKSMHSSLQNSPEKSHKSANSVSSKPGSLTSASNLSLIQTITKRDECLVKKADLNVLVVDDNLVNQEVMVRMLKLEGVKSIQVAQDGAVAVDKVKQAVADSRPFHIVFMDVQMPRMDGRQASRIIRTELNLDVPIVAVSAFANERNADECIDAGMNLFLSKPLVRPHLREILCRLSD